MKSQDEEKVLWIIRWLDPYHLECMTETREEVEKYAKKKAEEWNNEYVIN